MTSNEINVEILREIRDAVRVTNDRIDQSRLDLGGRIDQMGVELGGRIDQTNLRLGKVEETLVELAQQQRFVVRHLSALSTRDARIDGDLTALRVRVEALEEKVGGGR